MKKDDIAKIELKYSDRDIVLERGKGGPWRLVKPIGADADQTEANNLAGAIADCAVVRTVEEKPADVEPFGLEHPKTIVTVTTFDKKTWPVIDVGGIDADWLQRLCEAERQSRRAADLGGSRRG